MELEYDLQTMGLEQTREYKTYKVKRLGRELALKIVGYTFGWMIFVWFLQRAVVDEYRIWGWVMAAFFYVVPVGIAVYAFCYQIKYLKKLQDIPLQYAVVPVKLNVEIVLKEAGKIRANYKFDPDIRRTARWGEEVVLVHVPEDNKVWVEKMRDLKNQKKKQL